MKYLNGRYVSVFRHKGVDICTLKIAVPAEGDEPGYRIDNAELAGNVYSTIEEALKAINEV